MSESSTDAKAALIRTVAQSVINACYPGESVYFDRVWEQIAVRASADVCGIAHDEDTLLRIGLAFGPGGRSDLVSPAVILTTWAVALELGGQSGTLEDAQVEAAVRATTQALGGSPALAEELATALTPKLAALVRQLSNSEVSTSTLAETPGRARPLRAPDENPARADLWLVDLLSPAMIQNGKTRPERIPTTYLERHKGLAALKDSLLLLIDESDDYGVLVRTQDGTPEQVAWSRFQRGRGKVLHTILVKLGDERSTHLTARDIMGTTCTKNRKTDAWNLARQRKGSLSKALKGLADGLITGGGTGDYQLLAKIPYCWIRPAVTDRSRLLGGRPYGPPA